MSVWKFVTPRNAAFTLLAVNGGFMLSSAAVAILASTKPIWLKLLGPKASFAVGTSAR